MHVKHGDTFYYTHTARERNPAINIEKQVLLYKRWFNRVRRVSLFRELVVSFKRVFIVSHNIPSVKLSDGYVSRLPNIEISNGSILDVLKHARILGLWDIAQTNWVRTFFGEANVFFLFLFHKTNLKSSTDD